MTRQALSLVEVLVVIAIIAVLLALLSPTWRSMRDAARTAVCANHLRQLGLAGQGFASDQRGELPGSWWENDRHWTVQLGPYLESDWSWWNGSRGLAARQGTKLYRCPADRGLGGPYMHPRAVDGGPVSSGYPVTYSIGQGLSIWRPQADHPRIPHFNRYWAAHLRGYVAPDRGMMFADGNTKAWGESINTNWNHMTAFRHRGRAVTVMLSGRIVALTPGQFSSAFAYSWMK